MEAGSEIVWTLLYSPVSVSGWLTGSVIKAEDGRIRTLVGGSYIFESCSLDWQGPRWTAFL